MAKIYNGTVSIMNKTQAIALTGGLTQTSKMPCKSYSLPTAACVAGLKLSKVAGSICASCYAQKGFYAMYAATVEPAQHARLTGIELALLDAEYRAAWIESMQVLIGADEYFRFHDSGDLQSAAHLALYADLAESMPHCKFWLPTREYGMVKEFCSTRLIPENMVIRLSAIFPDQPVKVPASLNGVTGIAVSNVHKSTQATGFACPAYTRQGKCGDCRACWNREINVSYPLH